MAEASSALHTTEPPLTPLFQLHWAGAALVNMKNAIASMLESSTGGFRAIVVAEVGIVKSSGVAFVVQVPGNRSKGNNSLVTPISTLAASPAKINMDGFCAFQPKRVKV